MRALLIGGALAAALAATAQPRRSLDFGDVGIYACAYDFCDFVNLKCFASDDPQYYESRGELIHQAKQRGQYVMLGVYTWDRVWHKKPLEQTLADTDRLLEAVNLDEVDCIFLHEEEVDWSGGFDYLNAIYDHVKQRYNGPVYQWYSMPMGPRCDQKNDGWVLDAYGMPYEQFRKHVMKFVALGTPTVLCINATPGVDTLEIAQAQVRVAEEFNLPVFYFCVHGPQGSPNLWLQTDDREVARWRNWFFRTREKCHQTDTSRLPTQSAQHSEGVPIEVAADEEGQCEYLDDFSTYSFIDRATIHGFLNLQWNGMQKALSLKPGQQERKAELIYHWFTPFGLRKPRVSATGRLGGAGSSLGVSLSTNAKDWADERATGEAGEVEVGADDVAADWQGGNLWARVRLQAGAGGECRLSGVRLSSGFVPPEDKTYALTPGKVSYADDFAAQRYLHLGEVIGAEALEWRTGQLSIRGADGHPVRVEVKQHFRCEKPLRLTRVAANMLAHKNLGAHNELGLSLDGQTVIAQATTADREHKNGRFSGTVELDLSDVAEAARVSDFWVHLIMVNGSGKKGNTSNVLHGWELEATTAGE